MNNQEVLKKDVITGVELREAFYQSLSFGRIVSISLGRMGFSSIFFDNSGLIE